MEIHKIHNIEIYINDNRADIFSQDDLNLRFNNTFADPSKVSTIQTEYSFSFTLPITPSNQKIFDFADIPSKRGKFNKHFKTHINVDGMMIFDGDLILQSVSREGYKCNLYINRLNTVEKIFGSTTMNEITDWEVDYDQDKTINEYNSGTIDYSTRDIFYPLISYGMFQKVPFIGESYTSKFLIDDSAILYNENFYPSFNLLKLVEKCFNTKGYEVEGDIFDDKVLRKIYTSTPLADEQDPSYNWGKDSMGKFDMSFTWKNYLASSTSINGVTLQTNGYGAPISQSLENPRYAAGEGYFNWEYNNIYDLWTSGSQYLTTTFNRANNLLWRQNRLVAMSDGWYKIHLKLDYSIDQNVKFKRGYIVNKEEKVINSDGTWTFDEFPVEFQLVKNSEDGLDVKPITPDSFTATTFYNYKNGALEITIEPTVMTTTYKTEGIAAYPHEATWIENLDNFDISNPNIYLGGLCPKDGETLQYDPRVNPNFVLGCTTSGGFNLTSVIKNGKSWDKTCSDVGQARYICKDYNGLPLTTGSTTAVTETNMRVNTLPNSTMSISRNSSGTSASTTIEAIVFLKKNDYLQLKCLQRQWTNKDNAQDWNYGANEQTDAILNVSGNIKFEMFSPSDLLVSSDYMDWNNPSRYSDKLNISDFLPSDEKMSDFINNFIKEFNLSYSQNGNIISLNKQHIDFKTKNCVDLTDRVSEAEFEMEAIDFPSSMSVQYTINDEERGFYISAERNATDEQIQSSDWKEYADRGYDVIHILEDEYAEESKVTTKTSFNWFEEFKVSQDGQLMIPINIPIIAKDEWMIDGYRDADMMKNDGYNLKRRYWFPKGLNSSGAYIYLNGDKSKKVYLMETTSLYDGCSLSYKLTDGVADETLLTRYFNVFYDGDTNYIKFEVYLTTDEYVDIKNGSNIRVDDDIYIPIELKGYDCSGNNPTEITAIKK